MFYSLNIQTHQGKVMLLLERKSEKGLDIYIYIYVNGAPRCCVDIFEDYLTIPFSGMVYTSYTQR